MKAGRRASVEIASCESCQPHQPALHGMVDARAMPAKIEVLGHQDADQSVY
jgi:hypothetical protein